MPAKDINTSRPGLDVKEILCELEVPFSPDQVQWRVTVTANDRKRGQIVLYADPWCLHRSPECIAFVRRAPFECSAQIYGPL